MKSSFIRFINGRPGVREKGLWLLDTYTIGKKIVQGLLIRVLPYFRNLCETRVLAGPGVLGYKGGAFNPGAVYDAGDIVLLGKATHIAWYRARGKNRHLFLKGDPLLVTLEPTTLKINSREKVTKFIGFPESHPWAIEDMRLFRFQEKIFINHSLVEFGKDDSWFGQGKVSAALSVLDLDDQSIAFHAVPELNFPKRKIEKNWTYLEHDSELYLFYSLHPFTVLKYQEGKFITILRENCGLADIGGFGTMVSQSTNPIDYDQEHYLMVIHQTENRNFGRCYHHWAILISKETLLPVKITANPIFSGMGARGRTPGIRYISSIIKRGNEILFFAGEGDIYMTVSKRKVDQINQLMLQIK